MTDMTEGEGQRTDSDNVKTAPFIYLATLASPIVYTACYG